MRNVDKRAGTTVVERMEMVVGWQQLWIRWRWEKKAERVKEFLGSGVGETLHLGKILAYSKYSIKHGLNDSY